MLFTLGVLMAVPPSVAQLIGAGLRDRVAPIFWQGVWLSQALAVLAILVASSLEPLLWALEIEPEIIPTVAGYLKALRWGIPALCLYLLLRFLSEGMGSSRPTLYFGWLGVLVNVFANYALIYGKFGLPELGGVGCGVAQAVIMWFQFSMILLVVTRRRFHGTGWMSRFSLPDWRRIRPLLVVGLPIGATMSITRADRSFLVESSSSMRKR